MAKQVLIVDDDEAMAESLQRLLKTEGYEVKVRHSGKTALAFAAEQRPDLIILDVKLPDVGGYQVCRELRSIYHPWDVPVLMLTGLDRPIDQLRGFAHGADVYLTKPCGWQELLTSVKLLLGESVPA